MQNTTVLITGASRGLGLQIAKQFWQLGANLILAARSTEKLTAAQSDLLPTALPNQSITLAPIDLSVPGAVKKLISALAPHAIDVLINNAATLGPIGPAWENDWQLWQQSLQVNLLAPVELCQALVPAMVQRKSGKIINLSGGGATSPRPYFSAYAVAKAGLVRFSETLAVEVAPFNVQVNCIAPGRMQTDMLKEIIQAGVQSVGKKEHQLAAQPEQSATISNAAELCTLLAAKDQALTGKLISAVWDPWKTLAEHSEELNHSDIYTLRRIVPQDRGKNWEAAQ